MKTMQTQMLMTDHLECFETMARGGCGLLKYEEPPPDAEPVSGLPRPARSE